MSIYKALSFDPPIMAYAMFHQARKGVEPEAYTKTMLELHRLLREQTAEVQNLWKGSISSALSLSAKRIRGALTQFLTTPLKSDEEDIERAVRDELRELAGLVAADLPIGMTGSVEGRILTLTQDETIPKSTLARTRAYLRQLGFLVGSSSPPIFTSQFFVHGGHNLDVLEHLVRDRIGIYTATHGTHIKEFDNYSYALYNLVWLHGSVERGDETHEAALFFSKGETHYAPFRNAMMELMQKLVETHSLAHLSLWQRKLGLGVGREFVLKVRGNNPGRLSALLTGVTFKEKPFVPAALRKGYVVISEFLS